MVPLGPIVDANVPRRRDTKPLSSCGNSQGISYVLVTPSPGPSRRGQYWSSSAWFFMCLLASCLLTTRPDGHHGCATSAQASWFQLNVPWQPHPGGPTNIVLRYGEPPRTLYPGTGLPPKLPEPEVLLTAPRLPCSMRGSAAVRVFPNLAENLSCPGRDSDFDATQGC